MSGLVINFRNEDFDNREFPVLEPGEYIGKIVEATYGLSKSGNHTVTFVIDVTDPEGTVIKVWDYMSLTKKALWKIAAVMTAFGVPFKEKDVEMSLEFDEKGGDFPFGSGLKFTKDSEGKLHFLGFVTKDDSEFYPIIDHPLKVKVTKDTYLDSNNKKRPKNNIESMEAVNPVKPLSQDSVNKGVRKSLR